MHQGFHWQVWPGNWFLKKLHSLEHLGLRIIRASTNDKATGIFLVDSYIKHCITDKVGQWKNCSITRMQLTTGDFEYLGLCLQGFYFGAIDFL
jgi:hypothetical protein